MRSRFLVYPAMAIAGWACAPEQPTSSILESPTFAVSASHRDTELAAQMDAINVRLEGTGAAYRVALAEYLAEDGGSEVGATLLSRALGNKRLAFDFVPGDTRREWSAGGGSSLTYAIDATGDATPVFGGATAAQATEAIHRAMATWDGQTCSTLGLTENDTEGGDVGLVAFLNSLGGSPFVFADVQHAGFRDINFATGILGVTFTFVFVDDDGNITDADANGYGDAALREIYYDPSYNWRTNGLHIDIETVALHEAGHGLSQGHFGNLFNKGGFLAASPRAVMNAVYGGVLRELTGSDTGGHCGNWGSWPSY